MSGVQYAAIPGFPGYRVGTDGSVWSCRKQQGQRGKCRAGPVYVISDEWRKLSHRKRSDGYPSVELYVGDGKPHYYRVHTLVLTAFIGPRPAGEECCHRNGDRADCRLSNLRWGTRSDNMRDRVQHGVQIGSSHHNAKLTEEDVLEIRRRRAAGETCAALADAFGVTNSLISNIGNRKRWKHV